MLYRPQMEYINLPSHKLLLDYTLCNLGIWKVLHEETFLSLTNMLSSTKHFKYWQVNKSAAQTVTVLSLLDLTLLLSSNANWRIGANVVMKRWSLNLNKLWD